MGINKTISAIEGTPTLAGTLVHAGTAVDSNETVAATLYAVRFNGQQIDVRNYVPVALTGWTTFLRIVNTGSIAAAVSGAFINETTGVVGTAGVLISSLPAGASRTLDSTQIEAVLGAQTATARPRIRITAPTNSMEVQTYVFTPAGQFSIIHGTE